MQDAERLLRHYIDAGDGAEYARFDRILHPDVVTHSPGDVTTRGVDSQIAAWTAAHQGLDGLLHEIRAVVGSGDVAAARIRVTGDHRGRFLGVEPTGVRVEVDQALFIRVESSRIVEMWEVVDTGSGLRQLGLLGDQDLVPGPEAADT